MGSLIRLAAIPVAIGSFYVFSTIFTTLLTGDLGRYAYALRGVVPAFLIALIVRAGYKSAYSRDLAWFTLIGIFTIAALMLGLEFSRLSKIAPDFSLSERLAFFDKFTAVGAVITFIMSFLAARVLFVGTGLNRAGRKAPERSKKAVFGDADFMSMKEAAQVFPEGPGVVIGERYRPDKDGSAGPVFDPANKQTWGKGGRSPLLSYNATFGSTHGLIFAGSGGFKTTGVAVPTALNWDKSLVVLDPSCELAPMVSGAREEDFGKQAMTLDPDKPAGFNVLDWVVSSSAPEENIAAVANWLISEAGGSETGSDSFFRVSAVQLVTGILGELMLGAGYEAKDRNLKTFREIMASPEPLLKQRLQEIHDTTDNPFVRETVAPFTNMAEQTFSGVYATVSKDTQWLSFPRYSQLVAGDSFRTADILEGNVDVYVNIPLKALNDHPGMGRVIIGSFLNAMYEADGRAEEPVLFMLDEAATLGKMKIIETARDAGRKYKISMLLIYQSVGQLEEIWGTKTAKSKWYESTSYRIFAAINDETTAQELSRMCGDYTVKVTNTSLNRNISSARGSSSSGRSRSTTTQDQKRALLMPHEILSGMRTDEQLVFVTGRPPLRSGRAIYFRRPDMVKKVDQNRFAK